MKPLVFRTSACAIDVHIVSHPSIGRRVRTRVGEVSRVDEDVAVGDLAGPPLFQPVRVCVGDHLLLIFLSSLLFGLERPCANMWLTGKEYSIVVAGSWCCV